MCALKMTASYKLTYNLMEKMNAWGKYAPV